MEWLLPLTGAAAAAIAVPALLLLYFLKLKRRELLVSSTFLWKRAFQDLQVNAPFQKLRRNLLLLLQMLALAAILIALARPVLHLSAEAGRRHVILVDRSASMNASEDGVTRLEDATRRAALLVDNLAVKRAWHFTSQADQAMVIAFDARPQVLCNFTSDKARLKDAIASIAPSDGESRIRDAIAVARAFATPAGDETNNRSSEAPPRIELLSDGVIADAGEVVAAAGDLRFHRVGAARDNVAIVAAQARRSYEQPERISVFATLANFGAEAAAVDVRLSVNGAAAAVRQALVPPRDPRPRREGPLPDRGAPGRTSVVFTFNDPGEGVLRIEALAGDALRNDDLAWLIVPPPRRVAALLVTEGNPPLLAALRACALAKLDVLAPAEFDRLDPDALDAARTYGLIVLDRHAPARLPRTSCLVFGRPPAQSDAIVTGELEDQVCIDWSASHPLLQHVDMGGFFAAECLAIAPPRDAEVLAELGTAPALALVRRRGAVFILAPFDLLRTNFPFETCFVMFCQNAVAFAGGETGEEAGRMCRVWQPLTHRAAPGGPVRGVVRTPDGAQVELQADPGGIFRYAATGRAGLYGLRIGDASEVAFAVNLLDEQESDIAPADTLALAADAVQGSAADPAPANRELWPFLAAFVLVLVCLEWYVYNGKVRV
ncbi:MAG TPA: hypothetical protein DCM87_01470 [Planctomycetes bacterium]|nr:hypothetical protein [Planctomycetota bacterium]